MIVAIAAAILAPPAQAVAGDRLVGHRCRTYDAALTKEDTVAALVDTSGVPGAWCEIDLKKLSDGTVIVWHDRTWARVADATTLPAGVSATDRVQDATWSQARQIRTKGGAPVAKFADMIDESAARGVPLLVEAHNDTIRSPKTWVDYAREAGARVTYYQPVSPACTTEQLDALEAAGATVGIKTSTDASCKLTPWQIQAKGATLVVQDARSVTADFVDAMNARGVRVFARGGSSSTAPTLLRQGVNRLMVERPREALGW